MLSSKIWGGKEEVEERGRGGEGKRMRKQGEEEGKRMRKQGEEMEEGREGRESTEAKLCF